ncbi:MAG: hypothetical protein CMJ77_10760 [Planctomycetaceae bacterium]|nr:hypothetical protein [Planctomycetaceae bacterium]
MIENVGLVVLGCIVGFVLSGWVIARYKRQYETVRRQLANLRGENYGEQMATISAAMPSATSSLSPTIPPSPATDDEELERRCLELTDQISKLEQELDQARSVSTESVVPSTSTEGWQMAQLHREQITMQIKLDEHVATIASLQQENKSLRNRLQH